MDFKNYLNEALGWIDPEQTFHDIGRMTHAVWFNWYHSEPFSKPVVARGDSQTIVSSALEQGWIRVHGNWFHIYKYDDKTRKTMNNFLQENPKIFSSFHDEVHIERGIDKKIALISRQEYESNNHSLPANLRFY